MNNHPYYNPKSKKLWRPLRDSEVVSMLSSSGTFVWDTSVLKGCDEIFLQATKGGDAIHLLGQEAFEEEALNTGSRGFLSLGRRDIVENYFSLVPTGSAVAWNPYKEIGASLKDARVGLIPTYTPTASSAVFVIHDYDLAAIATLQNFPYIWLAQANEQVSC